MLPQGGLDYLLALVSISGPGVIRALWQEELGSLVPVPWTQEEGWSGKWAGRQTGPCGGNDPQQGLQGRLSGTPAGTGLWHIHQNCLFCVVPGHTAAQRLP